MSVVSLKEIHNGREGGDDFATMGNTGDDTRRFRAITSSPYDGTSTVLAACDNLGTVHPTRSALYLKSRRAVNEDRSKLVWNVTYKYGRLNAAYGGGNAQDPLSMWADITWDTEQSQESATYDKDSHAILNSVGDPYETGVDVESSNWTISVKKNVAYVPDWIDSYRNAINSDTFYVEGRMITPRTAKLSGLRIGSWAEMNGTWYRPLEMQIKIRTTWVKYVLDQGLRVLLADDTRVDAFDEYGVKATKPVLLDGAGSYLLDPSPTTAVFNTHYVYPEMPFSYLPLY